MNEGLKALSIVVSMKSTYVRPYRAEFEVHLRYALCYTNVQYLSNECTLLNYGWLSPPQKVGIFVWISNSLHHTPSYLSTGILCKTHTKTKLALKASFPCDAGLDKDKRTNRNPICFWNVVLAILKDGSNL